MADEATAVVEENAPVDNEASETTSGEAATEVEFPSFETEIPPEIAALLEEDETDISVTEDELDQLVEENEEVPREILARMRAAEKRAEHLERLRVADSRKNWSEEAKKFFPLAEPFLDEINATSRRGYLKTAKQVHDKMVPLIEEKILKPARDAMASTREETVTEVREEARNAWGQPVTQGAPSDAQVTVQQVSDRRRPRDLADTIKAMFLQEDKS